jgi:diadenylate cyclase
MFFLFTVGFLEIDWIDICDILLVSYLMFQLYLVIKGSVAVKILSGILVMYLIYVAVESLGMRLLSTILGQFLGVGVLAGIIIFQQEIRKFLLMLGRSSVFDKDNKFSPFSWKRTDNSKINITAIIEATFVLSSTKTGALMVLARSSELKFYAETGDMMNTILSKRLILSIFNKYSPLHDGAIIITNEGLIKAARCILPVSESAEIPPSLGLRHRAAAGLGEVSDAVILIVSEETGNVSLVSGDEMILNLSPAKLKKTLHTLLYQKITNETHESNAPDTSNLNADFVEHTREI